MKDKGIKGYNNAKKILVFNPEKVLILVARSARTAARTMNLKTQGVSYAALGKAISTGKHYFRYLNDEVNITVDDIGKLKLLDYDAMCGVQRNIFGSRSMNCRKVKRFPVKTM